MARKRAVPRKTPITRREPAKKPSVDPYGMTHKYTIGMTPNGQLIHHKIKLTKSGKFQRKIVDRKRSKAEGKTKYKYVPCGPKTMEKITNQNKRLCVYMKKHGNIFEGACLDDLV